MLVVSIGYLNPPELTKMRYRRDPFRADGYGQRGMMYDTGDLVRLRTDGKFDHLGSVDEQVKVGLATLVTPPVLTQRVQIVNSGADGELHEFYTPSSVSAAAVLEATIALQSCYTVPSKYIALDTLLLTSNGKLDQRRLCDMADDPDVRCEIVHVWWLILSGRQYRLFGRSLNLQRHGGGNREQEDFLLFLQSNAGIGIHPPPLKRFPLLRLRLR
ncbi:hypothetical protein BD311DRAFT_824984 [Dichomitus squalens]|uniref:Uncharacterized protein n=1 Tax=Dichomitus squalens TaxID=114155 RepID=A0A4Q9M5J5_9APHY|nr:hypothetical protein BD311DRAFT_824984 [Dichomitus squalens]